MGMIQGRKGIVIIIDNCIVYFVSMSVLSCSCGVKESGLGSLHRQEIWDN